MDLAYQRAGPASMNWWHTVRWAAPAARAGLSSTRAASASGGMPEWYQALPEQQNGLPATRLPSLGLQHAWVW